MLEAPYRPRAAYQNCLICGQKALAITHTKERVLAHCFYGCDQKSVWAVMRGQRPEHVTPWPEPKPKDCARVRHYAQQLWDGALPPQGTLVECYLASRSLCLLPDCLRFLPRHLHKNSGQYWPVMLAAVRDTQGKLQAVHRTYLAQDGGGKAPVEPVKMTLGTVGGFAIHLAAAGERLVIAEGIETALSVQQATGIPAWAAISAGNIGKLKLPPLPLAKDIIIAADNDPVGIKSAQSAAHTFQREGRAVRIARPPEGQDFNDVLQTGGAL